MSSATARSSSSLAVAAIEAVLELLHDAGVSSATRDAGALMPGPVGVLVGLPSLVSRTLAGASYTVPVSVISGDPLGAPYVVDRLYTLADDCARALRVDTYSPGSFSAGVNSEPLPALELVALVTLTDGGT